jgi:hypothetical protein
MSTVQSEIQRNIEEAISEGATDAKWEEDNRKGDTVKAKAGPLTLVVVTSHIHYPDSIVGGVRPFDENLRPLEADTAEEAKQEIEQKALGYLKAAADEIVTGEISDATEETGTGRLPFDVMGAFEVRRSAEEDEKFHLVKSDSPPGPVDALCGAVSEPCNVAIDEWGITGPEEVSGLGKPASSVSFCKDCGQRAREIV